MNKSQQEKDRIRWDGLVLQEVNALVFIHRYLGAHKKYKTVRKHLSTLLSGGYVVQGADGNYEVTERGRAIVKGIYGDIIKHVHEQQV